MSFSKDDVMNRDILPILDIYKDDFDLDGIADDKDIIGYNRRTGYFLRDLEPGQLFEKLMQYDVTV